jgi:hypothetical protein
MEYLEYAGHDPRRCEKHVKVFSNETNEKIGRFKAAGENMIQVRGAVYSVIMTQEGKYVLEDPTKERYILR